MEKKEKIYLDGWYDFGCTMKPYRVEYGSLPNPPYKKFDTYEECRDHIAKRIANKM